MPCKAIQIAIIVASLLVPSVPARAADDPAATPILPPVSAWQGRSLELMVGNDHPWVTPSEQSRLTATPRYDETVAWLARLVEATPKLKMISIGKSAEGRDIWMVIANAAGASTPGELRASGKPTLLAHSGIHAGEIDGKDAGLMLLRDMTVRGTKGGLLDKANFLFVPILSVDGHERFSAYSRVNQRGPVEMGWRTNRRNLNLNRDFAKLETNELRALVRTINEWQPDLYFDLHVTDGQDYQYDITFGYNAPYAWSPSIARWLDTVLRPAVDRDLTAMDHIPGPLTFGANGRDMLGGNVQWTAPPRFSNGWGDARHLPTVLVENHSLKPYDQRVLGTYLFLETGLKVLGRDYESLRRATTEDRDRRDATVPLGFLADPNATPANVPFEGVRSELYLSPISGAMTVRWTGEAIEQDLPLVKFDQPTTRVRRPSSYYIPAAWSHIAGILERQGIALESIEETTTVTVEMYRLPDAALNASGSPFEGRTLYTPGEPAPERRELLLHPGSFRVSTEQDLSTLIVLLLEPQSGDSLFQWGYFGEILQRTEYVEAYVMEPMARAMLEADPQLREAFEAKLLADSEFAGSARARLQWFYEKTPFFDEEHRLYPIGRSLD